MSAYVCDLNHIAYLVRAGLSYRRSHRGALSWLKDGNEADQCRVGQMLWNENFKSVQYRYTNLEINNYTFPRRLPQFHGMHPPQIFKSCDCYEYQTCEHPGWESSEARSYIQAVRKRAESSVTEYDDMIWGSPDPIGAESYRAKQLAMYNALRAEEATP